MQKGDKVIVQDPEGISIETPLKGVVEAVAYEVMIEGYGRIVVSDAWVKKAEN